MFLQLVIVMYKWPFGEISRKSVSNTSLKQISNKLVITGAFTRIHKLLCTFLNDACIMIITKSKNTCSHQQWIINIHSHDMYTIFVCYAFRIFPVNLLQDSKVNVDLSDQYIVSSYIATAYGWNAV